MAHRFTIGAALAAGLWLAGCGAPGGEPAQNVAEESQARHVELPHVADSAVAVASDLEIGRLVEPPRRRMAEPLAERPAPVPSEPEPDLTTALGSMDATPQLSNTAVADEAPVVLAAAPSAPDIPAREVVPDLGRVRRGSARGWDPEPIGRIPGGPTVIIRGGRGGIDDDCDLHRPGIRRMGGVPTAIHRLAPQPQGRWR